MRGVEWCLLPPPVVQLMNLVVLVHPSPLLACVGAGHNLAVRSMTGTGDGYVPLLHCAPSHARACKAIGASSRDAALGSLVLFALRAVLWLLPSVL